MSLILKRVSGAPLGLAVTFWLLPTLLIGLLNFTQRKKIKLQFPITILNWFWALFCTNGLLTYLSNFTSDKWVVENYLVVSVMVAGIIIPLFFIVRKYV